METCSNKVSRDSHPIDSIINVGKIENKEL